VAVPVRRNLWVLPDERHRREGWLTMVQRAPRFGLPRSAVGVALTILGAAMLVSVLAIVLVFAFVKPSCACTTPALPTPRAPVAGDART
jgi:hypothetical protein